MGLRGLLKKRREIKTTVLVKMSGDGLVEVGKESSGEVTEKVRYKCGVCEQQVTNSSGRGEVWSIWPIGSRQEMAGWIKRAYE